MELMIGVLAVLVALFLLIAPIVALVLAIQAAGRVRRLHGEVAMLAGEVRRLAGVVERTGVAAQPAAAPAPAVERAPASQPGWPGPVGHAPVPDVAVAAASREAGPEAGPVLPTAVAPAPAGAAAGAAPPTPAPAAPGEPPAPTLDIASSSSSAAARDAEAAAGAPRAAGEAAPPPPAAAAPGAPAAGPPVAPPVPPRSLEERIGVTWLTRIGVLLVIVGLAFFFKYMVDNEVLGPWGRVLVGLLAGAGFLAWGELQARAGKAHAAFVQGVLALGLSLLLVSAYACCGFYHLVDTMPAFAVIALLAVLGGALAALHRSEAILVLSLLAVLLNPVLLSTGEDRPLALFGYLLVMTGGALALATRLRFRVAPWVAVAVVVALFAGWYARFFDISPPFAPGVDQPPAALQGDYYPLVARWVPLVFALLFPLLWLAAGLYGRRRGQPASGLAMLLTAAVAAHAAHAALLHDQALLLGGVLCVLGLGSALLLVRERETGWLGVPLLSSFIVLVSLTGRFPESRLLPMMLLGVGWSAIYFGILLRTTLAASGTVSRWALVLLGAAGVGLGLLGLLWLLEGHHTLFGLLLTLLAGVYLLLGLGAGSLLTFLAAFLLGLGGMCLAAAQAEGTDAGFLLVACVWALLHLAVICIDLFVRGAPWSRGRMVVLTGTGLGFLALLLLATDEQASTLRALLCLAAAVLYLLIGLRMRLEAARRGPGLVLLPLGMALALLTLTVGLLFTGVTVTVLWAAQAAVLAYLASIGRQRAWMAASLALFVLATARLLLLDIGWVGAQQDLFWATAGREGLLVPSPFLHPRAWALAGLGLALLEGARSASRVRGHGSVFPAGAVVLLIAGHAALLTLLVLESQVLFLPAGPQAGLPADELLALRQSWYQELYAAGDLLGMVATVVLGAYAALLLGLGFLARSKAHRLLAIVLFGITLLKLVLWDIWSLARVYQIGVLVSLGLLLLAGGYLYARFGRRILRGLLDSGEGEGGQGSAGSAASGASAAPAPAAASSPAPAAERLGSTIGGTGRAVLLLLGALLLAPAPAWAFTPERYAQVRDIDGLQQPGDHRLAVDPALYAASSTWPPLQDVRIAGPDGAEVPFVLRPVVPPASRLHLPARILDPVLLPDGGSQAVLDLGRPGLAHLRVQLELEGEDFLRKVRVESGNDGVSFGLLAEGGYVFSVLAGGERTRHMTVRYPESAARYLRITLLPGADGQRLPIRGARVEQAGSPAAALPSEGVIPLALQGPLQPELEEEGEEADARPPSARNRTQWAAQDRPQRGWSRALLAPLPPGVPFSALELIVATPAFVRRVQVEGSTHAQAWLPLGGGIIYRVPQPELGPGAPPDEQLVLPIRPEGKPLLRLRVEDRDDAPLDVTGVNGRYRLEELVLRVAAPGPHRLYVGRKDDRAPRYDLEAILGRRAGPAVLPEARFGALRPNPDLAGPEAAKPRPWTERHARWLQAVIVVLVLGLGVWTVRLILKGRAGAEESRVE